MAMTTVFVDRAVRGELPQICVRTGRPADLWVAIDKPVGGMGAAAWVLLVLGPLGWIALAIVSTLGTGREVLTVRLPYSDHAVARYRSLKRTRFLAGTGALAALVMAVLAPAMIGGAPVWLIVAGAAFLIALVAQVRLGFAEVDVRLDGSRRWVTLVGVHDRFAAAVEPTEVTFRPGP